MDFIVGLPSYRGNTVIFVVVDRFSKACHLGMLPTISTAFKTAELFTSIYCHHHGFSGVLSQIETYYSLATFGGHYLNYIDAITNKLGLPSVKGWSNRVLKRYLQHYLRAFVHENLKLGENF